MTHTPADVRAFFDAHWTVRKYKNVVIPDDHMDVILGAAQRAPTDASAQLYSFIRLRDPALREKVAQLTTNAHFASASEAFIVCADVHRLDAILKTSGAALADLPNIANHFGLGDAVMAGENLLIAAEMLGYRGCWIGGVLNALEEICQLTGLPHGVLPFAGLTIGVPDEPPVHRARVARDLVIHNDRYREAAPSELITAIEVMSAQHGPGKWAEMMKRYFADGGSMQAREPHLRALIQKQLHR